MFSHPFNGAAFSGGVSAFEKDEQFQPFFLDMALHLQQLNL
jgi:hypothetical protein